MARYAMYGPTLLRVSLGVIFLIHSLYLKLVVFTMAGTVAFFESLGLPGLLTYLVVAVEVVGGTALILGAGVRLASAALMLVSLGATWAHGAAGWLFTNSGGGWEYPLFLAATCAVLVLLGPGALRLRSIRSKVAAPARG